MTARAALALALFAACGDDGGRAVVRPDAPIGATPRETITENVPLVVNEIVEAVIAGGEGDDYARIVMMAGGAPFDWNVHGHANGGTQNVVEELAATSVDYVFLPSASADWYLLIRNKGPTDINLSLQIDLFGEMTWSGWQ